MAAAQNKMQYVRLGSSGLRVRGRELGMASCSFKREGVQDHSRYVRPSQWSKRHLCVPPLTGCMSCAFNARKFGRKLISALTNRRVQQCVA
jgi:hypothetical protein